MGTYCSLAVFYTYQAVFTRSVNSTLRHNTKTALQEAIFSATLETLVTHNVFCLVPGTLATTNSRQTRSSALHIVVLVVVAAGK